MAKLNYRRFGEGEPIIIMHGLYGSSDNWVTIARFLMQQFSVYVLDMRNHGASPHLPDHNYDVMVDDLVEFMNDESIYSAVLLGHSMGGKVAMFFAAIYPERVKKLIIVDISPRSYEGGLGDHQEGEHKRILKALSDLNLEKLVSRQDAEKELLESIKSERIVQFLMKSLRRERDKTFYWKINIDVLFKNLPNILVGLENNKNEIKHFSNPVLFIKGGNSSYIKENDEIIIFELFKNVRIETIAGASHWLHAEKPLELLNLINEFTLS
ncbi:MAG: alpha/beta fold hydrolase [Salinivirgaceae bacterium]|jgi:esterase|nr:alpha/beta fold hydrolase [Salinivirgaceae bacterium]